MLIYTQGSEEEALGRSNGAVDDHGCCASEGSMLRETACREATPVTDLPELPLGRETSLLATFVKTVIPVFPNNTFNSFTCCVIVSSVILCC